MVVSTSLAEALTTATPATAAKRLAPTGTEALLDVVLDEVLGGGICTVDLERFVASFRMRDDEHFRRAVVAALERRAIIAAVCL